MVSRRATLVAFTFGKEFVMSIPATHCGPLRGRRRIRHVAFDPARIVAVLKLLRDVFVEARAMADEAKRRYPHFE
jgi:hypothetical protein